MLPGFRVLLAAIALTFSTVIFALGAAALLRASHEQFASLPALRVPEPASPTLAMLQVETASAVPPSPAAARLDEPGPAAEVAETADVPQSTPAIAAPPEPMPTADTPPDPVPTEEAAAVVAALAPDIGTTREASPEPSREPSVESSVDPVVLPEPAPARSEPPAIGPAASVTGPQAEIRIAALAPADTPADTPSPAAAPTVADSPDATDQPAGAAIINQPTDVPPDLPVTTAVLDQAAPAPTALPSAVAIDGPVPLPKSRATALTHSAPRIVKPRKRRMATQAGRARPVRRAAPAAAAQQQPQALFPGLFPFQ